MKHRELLLISHYLCPYVQRSLITLFEKEVEHQRQYIDLANKPQWFTELSPLGKVPLLQVDGEATVFESAVICEFLDEVTPGSLHPSEPLEKAWHRAWIEFGSQLLNDLVRLYSADAESSFNDSVSEIRSKLQRLEPEVKGPWFGGERFSLTDAAYGPIFRYFETLDAYMPADLFESLPMVQGWRAALASRPSVQAAVSEDYPAQLKAFFLGRKSFLASLIAEQVTRSSTTEVGASLALAVDR